MAVAQFKSTKKLALVLSTVFVFMMLSAFARAGVNLAGLGFVDKIVDQKSVTKEDGESIDRMETSVTQVNMAVQAVLAVLFVVWIYRLRNNLSALNVEGVRASRAACIYSWFIPIVSSFWPCFIMMEVWKASTPETSEGTDWRSNRWSPLVVSWWVLFQAYYLISILANLMAKAFKVTTPTNVEMLSSFYFVSFIAQLFSVMACGLGIVMVISLTKRQEEKYELVRIGADEGESE